ncbi:hypothetical protein D3C76_1438100 [compost metagenome]
MGDGLLRGERRHCLPFWQHTGRIFAGRLVSKLAGRRLSGIGTTHQADTQSGTEKNTKIEHLQLTDKDLTHFNHALGKVLINQGSAHARLPSNSKRRQLP